MKEASHSERSVWLCTYYVQPQVTLVCGHRSQKSVRLWHTDWRTHESTFWGSGNVLYLDYDIDYVGTYIVKSPKCTFVHSTLCKFYLNKTTVRQKWEEKKLKEKYKRGDGYDNCSS